MHDSRTVANRFLAFASADNRPLTPMQVLKLVYIAHGWSLGLTGEPLIRDAVQAWQYGPVIPRLYNSLRMFRDQPVPSLIAADADDSLSNSEESLVRQVWDRYGSYTGIQLSRLTHAPGTPWDQTYERDSFGIPISNDIIRDHYQRLAQVRA